MARPMFKDVQVFGVFMVRDLERREDVYYQLCSGGASWEVDNPYSSEPHRIGKNPIYFDRTTRVHRPRGVTKNGMGNQAKPYPFLETVEDHNRDPE